MKKIPVNVFTGYLGSGKTTIIMNLLKQLPKDYNAVLLKNEFGDLKIDSEIAKEENIKVTEFINGCLCCVLVGKLGNAIEEIIAKYSPDRIIIETSGSAYPAPIALELNKMDDKLFIDSIVTVIDAINFEGYKDKSYTAKLQAQFTDLILVNKHELISEQELETVLDDVYDLNPTTPKIKTEKGIVSQDLVFGIDKSLFRNRRDLVNDVHDSHHREVEVLEVNSDKTFNMDNVANFLNKVDKEYIYRLKGIFKSKNSYFLINYVFGRYSTEEMKNYKGETKVLIIGNELKKFENTIADGLEISTSNINYLSKY